MSGNRMGPPTARNKMSTGGVMRLTRLIPLHHLQRLYCIIKISHTCNEFISKSKIQLWFSDLGLRPRKKTMIVFCLCGMDEAHSITPFATVVLYHKTTGINPLFLGLIYGHAPACILPGIAQFTPFCNPAVDNPFSSSN